MASNSVKSVSAALKSYLASCKANGLANGTIENYERVVSEYIQFLNDKGYEEATIGSASEWKIAMDEKGTKITVISSKMGMVRSAMEWMKQMELIEKNPFIPTVMPSRKAVNAVKNRPYEHVLTTEDFNRIIHAGKPKAVCELNWKRNRAILIMFLTTALRNSEMRDLTLNDLDFKNGSISVKHGKGDKARIAAFPRIAQEAVEEYLESGYRPKKAKNNDYLFGTVDSNGKWKQFDRATLTQLVERNVRLITGKKSMRSHSLRHGAATQYFARGLDVSSISDLLGHASVNTTQIYIEKLNPNMPSQKANELFDDVQNVRMA